MSVDVEGLIAQTDKYLIPEPGEATNSRILQKREPGCRKFFVQYLYRFGCEALEHLGGEATEVEW